MNVLPVLLLLHIALTDKARQEGRYQRTDFVLGAGALLMIAVGLTSKAIWMTNACEIGMSFILEYPQFLTLETGRMPDSIGQDAFSEVK